MFGDNQKQNVSTGAVAVQAGNDVNIIHNGLSYSEVRDVALDVFRANFLQLAGPAMETAKARAEEITEDFLKKLQEENPSGFGKGQDPDFQHALFTVQREYARSGDKDLGDLLIDLLVDRSKQDQRDILQIVLNESLATAPKLTDSHLAVLALKFLFQYTQNFGIGNHQLLGEYFDKYALPFSSKLVKNQACFQHLEFTGCGSIQMGESSLEAILDHFYGGQFFKGFDQSEIAARKISIGLDENFFMTCLNDPSKIQVRANNATQLQNTLNDKNINDEDQEKILALFNIEKMSNLEIRETCISIRPFMQDIFDAWSNSSMKSFTLTSVGMAIGHANIKRFVGEFASLSIWIN
ncbi:hypothetical protein HXW90_08775 [Pseudomonas sp. Y39-6]|uniref:LPO_1073/Vpar_1526 family protein n=1 Tax=Pseudomonas sp. Y39-6 TaxID=2749807 RepID=UPI001910D252|nr:LPO_1073/Vpar_1526 family protein [Pseudomonas sp. Y39-6]QPO19628.1 hypothetical protein HXW90_08775 [Pseudomonas sp. Y39-6]URS62750.1 hypothetical protein JN756_08780 [Pseudomonas sp. Y39-6]